MIPKIEIKRHDPEVQEKYDAMTSRRRELNDQLGEVTGEINTILGALGEQVAEGKVYQKSTARLATLRQQVEALEAGILFVDGQRGLVERMNPWLRSR